MQPRSNKDVRKETSEKVKSLAGTTLIYIVVLGILLLCGFSAPLTPKSEEGILVNFGTDETGSGMIEPSPPSNQEETSAPALPPAPATAPAASEKNTEEGPLLTQNNEEAPAIKKVDPESEKRRLEKIQSDKVNHEALEAERIRKEQENIEKKKIEAEQQRQTDIMNRTKDALANARNTGTNSTSEGIAGGTGNQGVLNGSVDSQNHGEGGGLGNRGISYDLQGRGCQKLPMPNYLYQGEGKVVVEVSVDRSGKVIQARPGIKGSTTIDEYLLKVAKEAALEATFKVKADAPVVQKGTITYIFILK
jgi:colicin import membrane protein